MLEIIKFSIVCNGLFSPDSHVLVAVSGGADSVSLLHVLNRLSAELKIQLTVVHLNHCLRGKESDEDAAFVKRLAERLKCKHIEKRVDVLKLAREGGISLEMAAREARYAFFAETARRAGADMVATAHTADDQAETVLLKLARGAGPGGLSGIARLKVLNGLRVVRPMLDITRNQVLDFLNEQQLAWREDRSNDDTSFLRNRVRHIILPIMEKGLNPKLKEAIRRTADILRDEDSWLDELTKVLVETCVADDNSIVLKKLGQQPMAARRRILRTWLVARGVPADKIDFDTIERIERLAGSRQSSVNITGGIAVKKRYGSLAVIPLGGGNTPAFKAVLNMPGETVMFDESLRITVTRETGLIKERPIKAGFLPARASISSEMVGRKKLYVRSWRKGDRMVPLGLGGSKKVQDIFVDDKVPVELRGAIPLVECGGMIVWIPGYRIADGWEIKNKDIPALQICIERI